MQDTEFQMNTENPNHPISLPPTSPQKIQIKPYNKPPYLSMKALQILVQ